MTEPAAENAMPSAAYFADFASSYNEDIDRLLTHFQHDLGSKEIGEFVDSIYAYLMNQAESSSILERLSPEEFEHLKSNQGRHLQSLLTPGIKPQAQFERALHVGWIHEMVGVGLPIAMQTYHLYHRKVDEIVDATPLSIVDRERLRGALHQRLQLDVEAQISSHARFDVEIVLLLANLDQAIQKADNLADLLRFGLQALSDFEGISGCLFSRPDAHGVMQIEAEGGQEGLRYAEALKSQRAPLFDTQTMTDAGNGTAGRAWRSGQIQISNSFYQDESMRPWRAVAKACGFRSSAAVPLLDESGQTFGILSLYSSWPGFFSAVTREAMLRHIQQAMSPAILRCEQSTVVPAERRRIYRQCLEDGAVQMLYQPIIDLRTGELHSVEALARLRGADGQPICPAEFLPSFGNAGLLRLFQLGLEQVCRDVRSWREREPDLNLPVGLNLPPDGLIQDAYRDSVFDTLSSWELAPDALYLEMLETRESMDTGRRDARIAEFQQGGIRVVQDDLGSGHSSLLRMDRVPCDRVKIDQGLVRGALKRPVRALEFIYHLTLLARGFGTPVTVEGLEDEGLIEAAAILGADHGQGYGIARPMPAEDLMHWKDTWSFTVDPEQPRTALGALAGYLLWDHKLGTLAAWPDLAANFIKEPWLVHRYLDRAGKSDSELSMMLEQTQIVALRGQRNPKYARMRHELIERLAATWLQERD